MTSEVAAGLSTFAGLRVVEMGVWVAAPSAAALLADWGADVIKVEPPAGDPMRFVFGSLGIESDMPNPAFALDNRGKRSVILNLREEADQQHGARALHRRGILRYDVQSSLFMDLPPLDGANGLLEDPPSVA